MEKQIWKKINFEKKKGIILGKNVIVGSSGYALL